MARTKSKAVAQPTLIVDNAPASVPAVQQQGGAVATATVDPIFAIIERLSKDKDFDVTKMERLIEMKERAEAQQARAEYDQSMSLAQAEMKMIRANKSNSQTTSKYATQAAIDKAIRPIYTKHGFALSTTTGDAPNPQDVRVLTTVSHRGGHREVYKLDVPADGKGAKGNDVMTRTHAVGAALTYGGRYLEKMIFNLAIAGDNDGNDAADPAERAKIWTDTAITHLNTTKPDKDALAKYATDNEKAIAWLKKNAPDEFARYQIAYSNAAEAAGIPKAEPKRGGTKAKPASPGASPHSDPEKGDQPEAKAATGTAPSGPVVTDVIDQNAAIDFGEFPSARAFLDFSSKWMAEPARTPAEAKQWEEKFRDKIKEYSEHKFAWIKESISDTIAVYSTVLAKEPPA